jgi:hypothetical protein
MSYIRSHSSDIALAAMLFVIMTVIGGYVISAYELRKEYFPRFGPALSFGCDGPLDDIMQVRGEEIPHWFANAEAFLAKESPSFDCDDLTPKPDAVEKWTYQKLHQYSMYLVGGIWRTFGVSWQPISTLQALIFGLTGLFSFLIAKRFVGNWLAVVVTLTFMTSASITQTVLTFRDFSRAPMVLVSILVIIVVIDSARSIRAVLAGSAIAGLIAGIGLGFRADALALTVFFAVASTLLFSGRWRTGLLWRLVPFGVFIVIFVISSLPVLRAYQEDGFSYTTFQRVEGLVTPFNRALGLKVPFYDHGAPYNDNFSHIAMFAVEARELDIDYYPPPEQKIPENLSILSRISSDYYVDLVRIFPADFLIRIYRAIEITATLPLDDTRVNYPQDSIWGLRDSVVDGVTAIIISPFLLVVFGLGLLVARNRRLGVLLVLILLYFGAVNTVQFDIRNNFHHELWFWISLGVVVEWVWGFGARIYKNGLRETIEKSMLLFETMWNDQTTRLASIRIASAGLVILVLITGVLFSARNYQSSQVDSFVSDALQLGTPIQLGIAEPYAAEMNFFSIDQTNDLPDDDYPKFWGSVRYLAINFDSTRCDTHQGTLDILHSGIGHVVIGDKTVFDRTFQIDFRSENGTKSTATVLFPAYYGTKLSFDGVGMNPSLANCVDSVLEIPSEGGPSITPYFLLNADWPNQPAYLTFD